MSSNEAITQAVTVMAPVFWKDMQPDFVPNAPRDFQELPAELKDTVRHYVELLAEALADAGQLVTPEHDAQVWNAGHRAGLHRSNPYVREGVAGGQVSDVPKETFIGHANDEDNHNGDTEGRDLDRFLDWLDDNGEFMASDVVDVATYNRKRAEFRARAVHAASSSNGLSEGGAS